MNGEPLVHKAEPLLSQSACVVGHPSICVSLDGFTSGPSPPPIHLFNKPLGINVLGCWVLR